MRRNKNGLKLFVSAEGKILISSETSAQKKTKTKAGKDVVQPEEAVTIKKPTLKVHTIDMYQGDENDIVIVSLVRSNNKKMIGFLKLLNRRCVAQSRARCGLYFIGNSETLSTDTNWNTMITKMKEERMPWR